MLLRYAAGGLERWAATAATYLAVDALSLVSVANGPMSGARSGSTIYVDRYDADFALYGPGVSEIRYRGQQIFFTENGGFLTPDPVVGVTPPAHAVAVAGTCAYVADGTGGVRALDISDPTNPFEIGLIDTLGFVEGIAVAGNLAYAACKANGLRVLDVSTPGNPVEVGRYDTGGLARNVAVSGTQVFIADGTAGLRIIDVSNPSSPVEAGFYDSGGSTYGVVVDSIFAYCADGGGGFVVIDVSTPAAPSEVARLALPGLAYGLCLERNYAYVACGDAGLRIVYLADQANPVEVGLFDTADFARKVAVLDETVYLADDDDGLYVLQFYPPPTPTLVQAFRASPAGTGVRLEWRVFSDETVAGYRIYRREQGAARYAVLNAARLLPPESCSYSDATAGPGRSYEYVLGVIRPGQEEVLSPPAPVQTAKARLVLYQNYPNPFNPTTTIDFTLPELQRVTLVIYGVDGGKVRTLIDNKLAAGYRRAHWDGTNDAGHPVSSGIYVYRLTVGKSTLTKKMTLVR